MSNCCCPPAFAVRYRAAARLTCNRCTLFLLSPTVSQQGVARCVHTYSENTSDSSRLGCSLRFSSNPSFRAAISALFRAAGRQFSPALTNEITLLDVMTYPKVVSTYPCRLMIVVPPKTSFRGSACLFLKSSSNCSQPRISMLSAGDLGRGTDSSRCISRGQSPDRLKAALILPPVNVSSYALWHNYLRPHHSETRGVRGKGARDAGYPCPNANLTEGLVKEGRHTWSVTLSRSEVLKPDGL